VRTPRHRLAQPRLTGRAHEDAFEHAACRNLALAHLFDLELDNNGDWGLAETRIEKERRHLEAIALCRECPALALCRRLDTTGRQGVIAGRVIT
jgi:hypothetical protein